MTFDGTINLRNEFEQFTGDHGHFVILRRLESDIARVPSYDELYDTAHRDALRHFAQGRVYTDHILIARNRTVVPGFDKQHPVGQLQTPGLFFYLSYIAKPTKEDMVIEIALNDSGKPIKPFRVTHYYNIMDVDEDRDTGGQMSYFRLRVEERTTGGHE
jgi:hypothetical protein